METITSRKNPRIVHLRQLAQDRDYRWQLGEFVCEGEKLLNEAIHNGADITSLFFCGNVPAAAPEAVPLFSLPEDLLNFASALKNPPNLLFTCKMRHAPEQFSPKGFHLILEGIQDPGNVGTILRTANAFTVDSVLLCGGCADPYNPKTVRASMGAIFRQRFFETDLHSIRGLKKSGLRLLGAALTEGCKDIRNVDYTDCAVAVGSEGQGLSAEILSLCDEMIRIPMNTACESLNAAVAAAVILWTAVQKRDSRL